MALSGSTTKKYTPSSAFWVWVEWSATQDIANNRSTVTAITYGGSNSYGYYNGTNKWGYTSVDGVTTSVKYTSPWKVNTSKKELHRQTRVVNHSADGSKSLAIAGRWTAGSDPEGSFFNLYSSGTFSLDTIPRASVPTLSASRVALGEGLTISTNPASSAFRHKLKYSIGSLSGTIASDVTNSHTWTLPASLATAITDSTSGVVKVICETYNGSTRIGVKEVSFTATIPNNSTYQPVPSIQAVAEAAPGLSAFSVFIQDKSRLKVTSTASGKYGASIKQYRVSIDGSNYYGSVITSGVIRKSGTIKITLIATDSRGYSSTTSINVSVEPYSPPVISSFAADRAPTVQGENLSAVVSFSVSPLANQNTKRYLLRYRKKGGSWIGLIDEGGYYSRSTTHTATGVLDADFSYEVELAVEDYFTRVTKVVSIGTDFELINFHSSGRAVAFGKVSEIDNAVDFALPIYINGARAHMIIESGSNSLGSFVKFSDGTMICYASVNFYLPEMIESGAVWGHPSTALAPVVFPQPFIAPPVVSAQVEIGEALNAALRTASSTDFTWRLYLTIPLTQGLSKKLHYQAVGRWKA